MLISAVYVGYLGSCFVTASYDLFAFRVYSSEMFTQAEVISGLTERGLVNSKQSSFCLTDGDGYKWAENLGATIP